MTNFQRFRPLRWALLLCGATVLLTVAGIAFGQTFALQPAAQGDGDLSQPRGSRLITLSQMNLPGIDGTTIRTRKTWPWSFVDNCAATARQAGDMWTWLPCGGDERDPKTGQHEIHDRRLKVVLCTCLYKEQADLVQIAMNHFEEGAIQRMRDASIKGLPIPRSDS